MAWWNDYFSEDPPLNTPLNAGPVPRAPNQPGVAAGPIGRPPVGVITPDPLPTSQFVPSQQPGMPRPTMAPYMRPPGGMPANDLPGRGGYLGPPAREGFGKGGRGTPPGYLGPPLTDGSTKTPPPIGIDDNTREGGPIRPPMPPRQPPQEPGSWKAGQRARPPKGGPPRNPGDNDMPPPREQSLSGSEGWAGQGAGRASADDALRRYGPWPGASDPVAPRPTVTPGAPNYNPWTGTWS